MAKVYTYVPPINANAKVDTSDLATKVELKDGIQEAKNYTDIEITKLNSGANHQHNNKPLLDKFAESNGDLLFNGVSISGVVFEEIEG